MTPMMLKKQTLVGALLGALPLSLLIVAAGCSKSQDAAGGPPSPPPAPSAMRGGGGPGRGGRGGPVAATATGAEIYQQKCQGCHGDKGQGARGPSLQRVANRPAAQLAKIVHDGHDRMPAFGKQLTADQITKVVAYVKQFPAAAR